MRWTPEPLAIPRGPSQKHRESCPCRGIYIHGPGRIDREQIRSQNKDTLNEIINNTNLSETERQSAVQSMVEMTELVEKESATELLLEAKGFTDVVVNLTGETADIVVPMKEVTEEQRAQIEDIVTRKTGIGVENIVITP